jgi:hypothetical protein
VTVPTWAREQDAARAMSEWAVRRVVGGDGSGSSRTRAADEPCGGGRDARAERYGPVRYAVKKKEMGQRRSCVMHRVWSDESGRASERACAVVECRGRMPEWTCDVRRGWAATSGGVRAAKWMGRGGGRHQTSERNDQRVISSHGTAEPESPQAERAAAAGRAKGGPSAASERGSAEAERAAGAGGEEARRRGRAVTTATVPGGCCCRRHTRDRAERDDLNRHKRSAAAGRAKGGPSAASERASEHGSAEASASA